MSVAEDWARHVNPAFVELLGVFGYGRIFVRGQGVWLWDDQGRRYLDALAGFGACNLGHGHPGLLAAVSAHLASGAVSLNHVGPAPEGAALARELASRADPLTVAMLSSSGAEAVEAALKLAHRVTGRTRFLGCEGGFHGTNLGVLPLMGEARMRQPFAGLLPTSRLVPFGDLGALRAALAGRDVAAFVVEPVQAEGGVWIGPDGWLAEAAALCRAAGTLFVLDEVQTGIGRCGSLFMYQRAGVVPDLLCLAKALGGGLVPVAATLTRPELHARAYGTSETFDLHSSTFGGHALGCAAALATLRIVDEEALCDNAAARGVQLRDGLRARLAGHPLVREVRGEGLLVGLELGPTDAGILNRAAPWAVRGLSRRVFGQWAAARLLEAGVVAQPASQRWEVLRLEPPLTITAEEVDGLIDAVAGVLSEVRSVGPVLADVARRVAAQRAAGGGFR